MKRIITFNFMLLISCMIFFQSCIDSDYDTDDINESIVIGQDGFMISVGDLVAYQFYGKSPEIFNLPEKISFTYQQIIGEVFSEKFFDYFIYQDNGESKATGYIYLEGKVMAAIQIPPPSKDSFRFTIKAHILDYNGNELCDVTDETFSNVTFDELTSVNGKGISLKMEKDELLTLKESYARDLQLTFEVVDFDIPAFSETDFIQLKDLKIVSEGGIHFELDF